MMFLWFLFLIPLVFFLTAGMSEGGGWGAAARTPVPGGAPVGEAPIEIARKRLARGEITPAEFEEIRRAIGA